MRKVPDEKIIKKIYQWVAYAEADYKAANALLKLSDSSYHIAAFHAQQCAEKYLKGFLVLCGIKFPYTHNISTLLELCADQGTDWDKTLEDAEILTDYALTARYPGEDEPVLYEDALEAIELAAKVRQTVCDELEKCGIKINTHS
jgi:HEPN domain-containing protein